MVHFFRRRAHHPDPDLFLQGQRLSMIEEHRFLGLVFDSCLCWDSHIRSLKLRCTKALILVRTCAHSTWGSDLQDFSEVQIYRTLVRSKLDYGCEIYRSASRRRLALLDSVHHAGVRMSTGVFRSSPIPSLLCDAGELPLDVRR